MFGSKLQYLRKINNIKQDELAEKIKVSQKTISSWETNRTSPSVQDINKICEVFGVNMNYFSSNNNEEDYHLYSNNYQNKLSADNTEQSVTLSSVINNVEKLSKADKEALAKILIYMLKACDDSDFNNIIDNLK